MRPSVPIILSSALAVQAATPAGFQPGSQNDLVVVFGSNNLVTSGNVLPRDVTLVEPAVGALTRPNGTSYAVLMIDLDLPQPNPPTLLHWMQTGLTFATTATRLTLASGATQSVFLLQNSTNTPTAAPYRPPNPPARIPLSHRYVEILVDTSAATPAQLAALTGPVANNQSARLGFSAAQALAAAGLVDKVVAGTFFNVTNPGPVQSPNATGGGGGNGTSSTPPRPTQTAAAAVVSAQGAVAGLVVLAALAFAL